MFKNDFTPVGGGGSDVCEIMFEALSKTGNFIVTEGERGSENLQNCVTSFMDDPLMKRGNKPGFDMTK